MFTVNVQLHEINEALSAYKNWLSPEQVKMIKKRNEPFMIVRNAPLSTLVIWGTDGKDHSNT